MLTTSRPLIDHFVTTWPPLDNHMVTTWWQQSDHLATTCLFYKENRCLARYSLHTRTNPPTGHQMSRQGLFVPKKAYFRPNLDVFGQKVLIFMGGSKSFGTHVTEQPPGHLVCIVFWSGIGRNGQKMPIFGPKWPKCIFWAKFGRFWAKNPNFYGSQ